MAAEERGVFEVALVTGAARGIGLEFARQLAGRRMTVILGARDPEKAAAAAGAPVREGIDDARPKVLDVADAGSVGRLADELRGEFGRLDVLVNNVGAYADWTETASASDLDSSRAVIDTNLFGAWRVRQAFLPPIRHSEHGRIVNGSSGAGSHGEPRFGLATGGGAAASYSISKAALNALTAKLTAELDGVVLVNSVDPGLTATYPGAEALGARPGAEGAASMVWAATLPDDGPTGGFFRDGEPLPW